MTLDLYTFIGTLLLGSAVGVLTGFFGAGGGFILTPALNIFLGLDMTLAVGTSSVQVAAASVFTLQQRLDRRWLGLKVALISAIGIFPGTWLGGKMVEALKAAGGIQLYTGRNVPAADLVLLLLFALLLAAIMMGMTWELRHRHDDSQVWRPGLLHTCKIPPLYDFRTIPAGPFSIPVLIILGFGMGILSGLLGIGGGVVMLPVLLYLVGQDAKHATLTTTMIVFLSGVGSTAFHLMHGNLAWPLLPELLLGSFLGTHLGVRLQKHAGDRQLRKYFIGVVALALLMVGWKLYQLAA